MKVGYLVNTYPTISSTFIRREIHAVEDLGATVVRYAVRRWDDEFVDPDDRSEAARTTYLLSGRAGPLITTFLLTCMISPLRILRALGLTTRLIRNAGGGLIRHLAYLMEAAALKRATEADGVRHIHCHFSTNPVSVAMLAHAMGGPTFSFTAHGPDELVDPNAHSLSLKIESAAFVIAITSYCRSFLALIGGMEHWRKVHVIRCGLDLTEFPPSGQGFDTHELVCVGRLCPQKGQSLLLRAMADLVKTHPTLHVTLIGDGESRPVLEAEIRDLDLARNVTLAGWASNKDVRSHIGHARALVLPSLAEGLPIVIMEALALGRPVVTTYIAGIPELVDQGCGWIIPAGDVDALGQALLEVIEAPPETLAARGSEGRARIVAEHDLNASARQLTALFAKALAKNHVPARELGNFLLKSHSSALPKQATVKDAHG
ncbi:MAG: glycosyltransferase family 4 protein [Pseudomonadota bacterium]